MCKLVSCEFNIDTACVELLFADSSMISIDCIAVENEVADDRFDRAELDWLIYNKPMEYSGASKLGVTIKYSVIVFSCIPMMIAYPFVQRFFIKGVMIGAIKG